MPTFESIIIGAPAGFNQSCTDLNNLSVADPEFLATIVIKSLANANFVPSAPSESQYYNEIKAINFIIRSYKSASPAPTFPQMASVLDLNSLLTRDCVEKIIVVIQQNAANTEAGEVVPLLAQVIVASFMTRDFPTLLHSSPLHLQLSGKVQNLKWRVGVAMSSNKCKNISAPYVLLTFDIKEIDGTVSYHSTELTYEKFKEFKSSFERVAATMDEL